MSEQILTPSIFAVFAIGFALIWYHNRHLVASCIWAASYISAAIGFGLEPVYTNFPHTEVLRPVSDTGYIASALLLSVGLAVRYSQKVPKLFLGLIFFATFIPINWFWFIDDDFTIRSEIISYGCAALIMVGAVTIYPKIKSGMDRILFYIVTVFALHFAVVPIITVHILNESLNVSNFTDSLFLEVLNFTVSLIALSLAVVLFVGLGMEIIVGLRKEAQTDLLTKLDNRRAFEAQAVELIENAADNISVALIISDIDNFKQVNDTFGHSIGDDIIKVFSKILKSTCRQTDIVGRVGGEEFCILLPMANAKMAALVAETARTSFEQYKGSGAIANETFTASFGIAELQTGETYKALFTRADDALYSAKRNGRNQIKVNPEEIGNKPKLSAIAAN